MTLLAQTPSLRARQASLRTCARSERLNAGQRLCGYCPHPRAPGALALSLDREVEKQGERKRSSQRNGAEPRAEPLGEAQKSLRGAHGERSERLKMHASDCTQRSRRRSELRSLFYDAACADSPAAG